MEEATLRAKIQAMKNLLKAKEQSGNGKTTFSSTSYDSTRSHYAYNQSKNYTHSTPVNRSWNRFKSPATAVNRSHMSVKSANKVWKKENTSIATTVSVVSPLKDKEKEKALKMKAKNTTWTKPVKMVANQSKSMQLLRLEDGDYSKAKDGFSLVRAGVKKPTVTRHSDEDAASSRSNSNSVNVGGVKYVVANGGKALKRCSAEGRKMTASYRAGSKMSLATKTEAARAALFRAKATMRRERMKHLHVAKKSVKARTITCSFYDRFGFCKNKDACRFIHDSRRVAMCRKFLKNECNDPKCLLSHQHDENKVPDCKMFLRGACTRADCKYRHVKVSATAEVCEPFTKGYCPKGGVCPLRHELRKLPTTTAIGQESSNKSATVSGTLSPLCSTSSEVTSASAAFSGPGSPKEDKTELSIRPNIRFAPKHSGGFPSLFDGLRRIPK
ncbi:unnamed protein product [Peronospora effusa]|nr:unnamed protein product [Peronospora effusa]